jgi:hypothetical protein
VAAVQEADGLLLKQGHGDLTPSERRHRVSQHIWHVEHWNGTVHCHFHQLGYRPSSNLKFMGGISSGR